MRMFRPRRASAASTAAGGSFSIAVGRGTERVSRYIQGHYVALNELLRQLLYGIRRAAPYDGEGQGHSIDRGGAYRLVSVQSEPETPLGREIACPKWAHSRRRRICRGF